MSGLYTRTSPPGPTRSESRSAVHPHPPPATMTKLPFPTTMSSNSLPPSAVRALETSAKPAKSGVELLQDLRSGSASPYSLERLSARTISLSKVDRTESRRRNVPTSRRIAEPLKVAGLMAETLQATSRQSEPNVITSVRCGLPRTNAASLILKVECVSGGSNSGQALRKAQPENILLPQRLRLQGKQNISETPGARRGGIAASTSHDHSDPKPPRLRRLMESWPISPVQQAMGRQNFGSSKFSPWVKWPRTDAGGSSRGDHAGFSGPARAHDRWDCNPTSSASGATAAIRGTCPRGARA